MASNIKFEKKLETIFKQELKRNDAEFIDANCINKNLNFKLGETNLLIPVSAQGHGFKLVSNKYISDVHCTDFIFTFELADNEFVALLEKEDIKSKYNNIKYMQTKNIKSFKKLFIKIRCSVYNKHHVKVVVESTHKLDNIELINFSKHFICPVVPNYSFCQRVKRFFVSLF